MNYVNYNYSYRRNKIVEPSQLLASANIFTQTADQRFMLGCIMDFNNGDRFRYCKDSGTGITKARMAAAAAPAAELNAEVQTAYGAAAGKAKFDCLVTTASGLANHGLIDGWMHCDLGDAIGDMYLIKDNIWTTGDTVLNIEIADNGGLRTAIAATDTLTFIKNKYRDVVVAPATKVAQPIGVPLVTVTASYYFWAKTRGAAPIIVDTDEALVIGDLCGEPQSHAVDGAVGVFGATTARFWGTVMSVNAAASVALVDLCLE